MNSLRRIWKQLFCSHYHTDARVGWKFVKEVDGITTWRCYECGKERHGISAATFLGNMPKDSDDCIEYLIKVGRKR